MSVISPLGTATFFDALALIAAPQPWPHDAKDFPLVQERGDRWTKSTRVQLITGPETGAAEIVEFSAGDGPFRGFRSDTVDGAVVLVCCHGKRDVCCGGNGTRVALELEQTPDRPFRVWRTSHLGGHRFAPTALVLPEGTMWADADAAFLTAVVNRSISVTDALPHYRGCAGFATPEAQVADAGALLMTGWDWLDEPRTTSIVARTESTSDVRVEGAHHAYRAMVGVRRVVPAPRCGVEALDETTPVQTEYELLAIRTEPR